MPFEPTDQQIKLTAALARFCRGDIPSDTVFILNGYAGTGKTSVMGALVRALAKVNVPTVLLASTGRAAKVLSGFTGLPAYTIHRKIYTSSSFAADGSTSGQRINRNQHVNTIFIVDEASMIGEGNDARHGSAARPGDVCLHWHKLPADSSWRHRPAPPVGSSESPAMSAAVFKQMGLKVMRATITRTVRQASRSGILANATWLRRAMAMPQLPEPQLTATPYDDVEVVLPEDLEDALGQSFAEYGEEQTIMITRSNRRAVDFNLAIRRQIFDREEILGKGDRLIVAKNNYYWTRRERLRRIEDPSDTPDNPVPEFLANGEIAIVEEILSTEPRDMTLFADVQLYLPESATSITAKIVLDSLTADTAGLPREKIETIGRRTLLEAGCADGSVTAQREALKKCPYFNALQVKFAYAVTCHKAQGGQWQSVFVDMGYIPPEAYRTTDFYRWLYTSVTRATDRLSLLAPACRVN